MAESGTQASNAPSGAVEQCRTKTAVGDFETRLGVPGSGASRMWSGGQPLLASSVLATGAVPTQSVDHNLQLRAVPPQLLHPGSVFV